MGKLLHFEFHKLIRQRSFYICTAVMLVMLFVSAETTQLLYADAETLPEGLSAIDNMMSSASGSVLTMVLGVFIPLFVCEDFVSGTIRNIITRGYSRLGVFFSKLAAVLCAAVFMTVICMAAGYLVGLIFWGAGGESFGVRQIKILLSQIVVVIAAASLFYAISTTLLKTGGSMAVCLVLPMVMTIVLTLADTALAEKEIELSCYWIDRAAASIASDDVSSGDIKKALLTSLAYIVAAPGAAWLAVRKREY